MRRIVRFAALLALMAALSSTAFAVSASQPPSRIQPNPTRCDQTIPLEQNKELMGEIAEIAEDFNLDLISKILIALIFTLGISALAMLIALLFPKNTSVIANCFALSPGVSWAVGLLTLFSAIVAMIITTLTLILIPVSLAGVILLFGALLLGYVSVGYWVGHRIAESSRLKWAEPAAAGIGTMILSIIISAFSLIPSWMGSLAATLMIFIVSMFGLGSVTLTIFGSKPYPRCQAYPPLPPVQAGPVLNAQIGLSSLSTSPDVPLNKKPDLSNKTETAGTAKSPKKLQKK